MLLLVGCTFCPNPKHTPLRIQHGKQPSLILPQCPSAAADSVGIGLQSALFNFQSLLLVILLVICTCTYLRATAPSLIDRNKNGVFGLFWKFARIGERLSPYVAIACVTMAGVIVIG